MTSVRPSLLLLACGLLLMSVGAVGASLVSKKQTRSLEVAAKDLARAGRTQEFRDLVEILRSLGRDPAALAKVVKAGERLLRDPTGIVKADRAAKRLRSVAADMGKGLDELAPENARDLARLILEIDGDVRAAHLGLGHVLHEDQWVEAFMPAARAGRAAAEETVRQANRMPVEISTGTEEHAVLRALYGTEARFARHRGISIHSVTMSAQRLERILTRTVRSLALSRRLCGGNMALSEGMKKRFVHVDSAEKYREAIAEARMNGGLSAEASDQVAGLMNFDDNRGHVLCRWRTESRFLVGMFWFASDLHTADLFPSAPQACLEAGHLNWIALRMFGVPLGDAGGLDGKKGKEKLGGPPPDAELHERMLRIAPGGLQGSRSWITYLMRRGVDPPWQASMLDRFGRIRGTHRMKCTVIAEFLQESDLLGKLMKETVEADRNDAQSIRKAVEEALGLDLDEFERRLRVWLLPANRGLVQRLRAPESQAVDPVAGAMLDELNLIRAQALRGSTSLEDLPIDPALSAGATAHAHYLAKNPDEKTRWPNACEELMDREGYSPEGARAGRASVIAFGIKSGLEAISGWMGSYTHRLPLLSPGLRGIGWGLVKGVAVLDCGSLLERGLVHDPVVWPFRGMRNVPTRFRPELPNPVPGEQQSSWGYPVTLQLFGFDMAPELTMTLRVGEADGPTVPCHVSTPEHPLNPERAPRGAWCLIPRGRLKPGTLYTVVAEHVPTGADSSDRMEWSFRTGR